MSTPIGKILMGLLTMALVSTIVIWVMWKSLKKTEDPGRLVTKWVFSAILFGMLIFSAVRISGPGDAFITPIFAAVIGIILGITWAPHIGALLASPLMGLYEGGGTAEATPMYSIAQAKRKQGRYRDAQTEVRKQLDRFPNDFQGWMLMGEIFARDLRDMPGAARCVEQLVSCGVHTPRNVAFALTCLADWYLEIDHDRDSAKEALDRITELYPDSEQSQQAAQRLAHLGSKEMIQNKLDRTPIALKHYQPNLGLHTDPSQMPQPPQEDWEAKAAEIVRHLDDHPLDNEARENLATLYADHYHRADLAAEQLEQLIGAPNQSPKYIVHCLNRLADVYVQLEGDETKARQTLERIPALYPGSALAANAEKRITLLPAEMKKNVGSRSVQMGVYDQNIGLKGQVPRNPSI